MAIDLATLRTHVETGLVDAALQLLLDDAVAEVEGRFGTDDEFTWTANPYQAGVVVLPRAVLTITSITESSSRYSGEYTLVADDYELLHGGRLLRRLGNPYWTDIVTVVYVPKPEADLRDRVTIDLVKLAVQYNAVSAENIGDYSYQAGGAVNTIYLAERERILTGMINRRGFRFA